MISDTIVALATAPAPAGIAVVRLSGEMTTEIVEKHFIASTNPISLPRKAILGKIIDQNGEVLDHGMLLFFKGPNSYTGEDLAEFHLHGNPLLARKLIECLLASGARMADPGEFTQKAYLNNKIDLAQAEAVADLINANNEQAIKLANQNLAGSLTKSVMDIGEPLRDALAELEASIDFSDEDIEPTQAQELKVVIEFVIQNINNAILSYKHSEILRDGFRILLCGLPNTGKSSLLNNILGKRRAIVSEIPGTTRDIIEEPLLHSGYSLLFCDSAGIRETDDSIEKIGVELAIERLESSQLVLLVVANNYNSIEIDPIIKKCKAAEKKVWLVINKSDLGISNNTTIPYAEKTIEVSAKTGAGIEYLLNTIVSDAIERSISGEAGNKLYINLRQKHCFEQALPHLTKALQENRTEIISLEIRAALQYLDEIVGKTTTEDILGRIFSKFCIGK